MVFDLLTLQCRQDLQKYVLLRQSFSSYTAMEFTYIYKHLFWDLKMLEVAINLGHLRLGWEGGVVITMKLQMFFAGRIFIVK